MPLTRHNNDVLIILLTTIVWFWMPRFWKMVLYGCLHAVNRSTGGKKVFCNKLAFEILL